ncbi:MAG: lysostaphin resistance A-like protein [Candidatus Limnocylindria bacterium]
MDADRAGRRAAGAPDRAPLAGPSPEGPADQTPPSRWPAAGCALVVLAGFVVALLVSLLAAVAFRIDLGRPELLRPEQLLILTASSNAALVVVTFVLARRLLRASLPGLGLRAPTRRQVREALVAGLALWGASIVLSAVQATVTGVRPQAVVLALASHEGALAFALDFLAGAVLAPIGEELLYRGVLFAGLLQRSPFVVAAALSAGAFTLVHERGVALPIFALGFGLAWIYWRSGTLWAPIIAHGVANTISLALVYVLRDVTL